MVEDDDFAAPEFPQKKPHKNAAVPAEDLSELVRRSVEKSPGDEVKCTRISGDKYRCNWWAGQPTAGYDNPGMTGLLVTTHRVRKSRFLHAIRRDGRLVITELAEPRGGV